jgi:hypothetical protein
MKKSIFNFALALLVLGTGVASTSAFWEGNQITPGRFDEFKAIVIQSDTFEAFQESMKTIREEHRAEMKSMHESITHLVENIENGVVKTIISDDADVVIKIQSREDRAPRNEKTIRTVEQLSNGMRVITTSDDPETVKRMQSRAERGFGKGMGHKRGMRGEGMKGRFGKAGFEKSENWDDMKMEERRAFMLKNNMGSIEDRFEKSGVDMPENWNGMEREDRREFMQKNGMEGRYMQCGGNQRQHPSFRTNRRGGQGTNMNGQRKSNLRERFQGWMGQ